MESTRARCRAMLKALFRGSVPLDIGFYRTLLESGVRTQQSAIRTGTNECTRLDGRCSSPGNAHDLRVVEIHVQRLCALIYVVPWFAIVRPSRAIPADSLNL